MHIQSLMRAFHIRASASGKPSPVRKLTVLAVAASADDHGCVKIHYDTLAGMTELSNKQVKNAVMWMHKSGLLQKIEGTDARIGGANRWRYRLCFPGYVPEHVEPPVHEVPETGAHQPDYSQEFSAAARKREREEEQRQEQLARSLPEDSTWLKPNPRIPVAESNSHADEGDLGSQEPTEEGSDILQETSDDILRESVDILQEKGGDIEESTHVHVLKQDPNVLQESNSVVDSSSTIPLTAEGTNLEESRAHARTELVEAPLDQSPVHPYYGTAVNCSVDDIRRYRKMYPHIADMHGCLRGLDDHIQSLAANHTKEQKKPPPVPSIGQWLEWADQAAVLERQESPEKAAQQRMSDPNSLPSITTESGKVLMPGMGDARRILDGELSPVDWERQVRATLDIEEIGNFLDRCPDVFANA